MSGTGESVHDGTCTSAQRHRPTMCRGGARASGRLGVRDCGLEASRKSRRSQTRIPTCTCDRYYQYRYQLVSDSTTTDMIATLVALYVL